MSLHATEQSAHQNKADQVVIGFFKDQHKNQHTASFNDELKKHIEDRFNNKDFTGQSGQQVTLYLDNGQQLLLVGLGPNDKFSPTALYDTTHKVVSAAAASRCQSVALYLNDHEYEHIDAEQATKLVSLAASHAAYRYEDTKSFKDDNKHA